MIIYSGNNDRLATIASLTEAEEREFEQILECIKNFFETEFQEEIQSGKYEFIIGVNQSFFP